MGKFQHGNVSVGDVKYGKCPLREISVWEMSSMENIGMGIGGMGNVQYGKCLVWEMSVWEMSSMGIVQYGKCRYGK